MVAIPRGCNQCIDCKRISPVYTLFPVCRSCAEDVCPDCSENFDEETNRADCFRCNDWYVDDDNEVVYDEY